MLLSALERRRGGLPRIPRSAPFASFFPNFCLALWIPITSTAGTYRVETSYLRNSFEGVCSYLDGIHPLSISVLILQRVLGTTGALSMKPCWPAGAGVRLLAHQEPKEVIQQPTLVGRVGSRKCDAVLRCCPYATLVPVVCTTCRPSAPYCSY